MFTVTTGALHRLSRKLVRKNAKADQAFRFTRRDGGWTLCLDSPRKQDKEFRHDGRSVLALNATDLQMMENLKLGVKRTKAGFRLKLRKMTLDQD